MMKNSSSITNLGFSQYEATAYLALVANHPVNGSQLSRHSGIPRARIYDVLRSLKDKGMVVELGNGLYAPLPSEELIKRLRHRFETNLANLDEKLKAASKPTTYDYVWTIRGYTEVIAKAKEMIASAKTEIYVRLFPEEGQVLNKDLHEAVSRGVEVKYISIGRPSSFFDLQVVHPEAERIEAIVGGRPVELVGDREEILVGMFEKGKEDLSPFSWTKNRWFVLASKEGLRHDFFHYFLHKTYEKKQALTEKEKSLYELIKNDL